MTDKPNFAKAEEELASRQDDVLAVGDVVQEWEFKRDGVKGEWRWLSGDVLAVVLNPCVGMDWVAMIQWRERGEVRGWTTITSLTWRESIRYRRKPK